MKTTKRSAVAHHSKYFLKLMLLFSFLIAPFSPAQAGRVRDLGSWEGVRSNQLTGYGIVVGLPGTGDDNLVYSSEAMKGTVERFGLTLPDTKAPGLKNSAAVIVTAELPPFAKPGQRMDVTVSAIGKAKSLRGGTLLITPLYGADGQIYAMAQGNLVVSGLSADGADGSKLTVNIPSAGRIDGGASVERSVSGDLASTPMLQFNLTTFDVSNALLVSKAINDRFGSGFSEPLDGRTIAIYAPQGAAIRVQLMSDIENMTISTREPQAKVVINSRTGTVVITGNVRLHAVAVTHGSMTIAIEENPAVIQPAPFSQGRTATEESSTIRVEQGNNRIIKVPANTSLNDLIASLNRLGAGPSDLVAILQAMKEAGALEAELVII